MEYRIKKFINKYIIQVFVKKTTGMLFWKKYIDEWYDCDKHGNPIIVSDVSDRPLPSMKKYKTKKKAKKRIKNFNDIYDDIDHVGY